MRDRERDSIKITLSSNLSYLSASSRMLSVPNPSEYMLVSLLLSPSLDSLLPQPFISLF